MFKIFSFLGFIDMNQIGESIKNFFIFQKTINLYTIREQLLL